MKNIMQYNQKGNPHGYWELHWLNGTIMYKCFYNNGKSVSYSERYLLDNELNDKTYHI